MAIYRTFTRQTDQVVQYLSVARQFEHHTRVEVPKLKHAPVNLGKQLEEYLNDEDFEVHRRQYLAEQEVKKTGGSSSNSKVVVTTRKKETTDFPEPASNNPFPTASSSNAKPEAKPQANKGPDPDLIDFFDSIEQNQTPLQAQPQQQANTGFQQPAMGFQSTNGFAPMAAPQPTGFASNGPFQQQATGFVQQPQSQAPQLLQPSFTTGFGGFSPQQGFQPSSLAPIPQDTVASFQAASPPAVQPIQNGQPQGLQPMATGTNPFRQSMLMAQQTGLPVAQMPTAPVPAVPVSMPVSSMPTSLSTPALSSNPNRQSTNPFARNQQNTSPFSSTSSSPFQQPNQQVSPPPAPLAPAATGTNPFARHATQAPAPAPAQEQRPQTAGASLVAQPTGSTNPFRHGAFVNHNTGMGWQHNQQPIGGGLDQLETVPVFPRPAQQTPWQQ